MKVTASYRWMGIAALVLLLSALISTGCSNHSSAPPNPTAQQASSSTERTSQPPSTSSSQPAPTGPRPLYYDFQDIPIPNELSVLSSESQVFQLGSLKAGILVLRGRVDLNSLINFFQMALPRENWKAKGGFRYGRSILIFEKPDKTCVINFYEKLYYSYVEIYVAPSTGQV